MDNAAILELAVNAETSIERLAYIAAFAVSANASSERYYVNFNPLLGETFEYCDEEVGIKYLVEQVSHHPPISAAHAEGPGWVFWQNCSASTSFGGNSLEIDTNAKSHVFFPETRDHFFFTNPKAKVHNILLGKMWVEHFGDLVISNMKNGEKCVISFKKAGFFGSVNHQVTGHIERPSGRKVVTLEGEWNNYLNATWIKSGEEKNIWTVPENNIAHPKYLYTPFTEKLIQMDETLQNILPPTDSRLRCDRLLVEKNEFSSATRVKRMMEERQRQDRKEREELGEEWVPSYFHSIPDENGGEPNWVYFGDYWEERELKAQLVGDGNVEEAKQYLTGKNSINFACNFTKYTL